MGIMNVVYLNVRTLLGGKEHILIQDLIKYKIDIAFLSEVRCGMNKVIYNEG